MNFWKSDWEVVLIVLIAAGACTAQQMSTARKSIECVDHGGTWHANGSCSPDYCERIAK